MSTIEVPVQPVSNAAVTQASNADLSSVQGAASLMVLKKATSLQADGALQLIETLPQQPPLATSGSLGTRLNTYA